MDEQITKLIKRGKPIRWKLGNEDPIYGIAIQEELDPEIIYNGTVKIYPIGEDDNPTRNVKIINLSTPKVDWTKTDNEFYYDFVTAEESVEYITVEELMVALLLKQ